MAKKPNTSKSTPKSIQKQRERRQRQKRSFLERPRTNVSYALPKDIIQQQQQVLQLGSHEKQSNSGGTTSALSSTSASASASASRPKKEPDLVKLSRTKVLLTLIHRRNKNQHRNQPFFKWVNLLRQSIGQLIDLHREIDLLSQPVRVTADSNGKSKNTNNEGGNGIGKTPTPTTSTSERTRQRFETMSSVRSQIDVNVSWLRETLIPNAYVQFTALVADTQFANLGVVLVGILGEIGTVAGVNKMVVEKSPLQCAIVASSRTKRSERDSGGKIGVESVRGVSTLVTGPDQGEVVERVYDSGDNFNDKELDGDMGVPVQRQKQPSLSSQPSETKPTPKSKQISSTSSSSSPLTNLVDAASTKHPPDSMPSLQREKKHERDITSTKDNIKSKTSKPSKDEKEEKKKKKKSKKNAIDDLFAGFG